jgi:hypothetical protein
VFSASLRRLLGVSTNQIQLGVPFLAQPDYHNGRKFSLIT